MMGSGRPPVERIRVRPADLGWVASGLGLVVASGLVALRQANASDIEPGSTAVETVGWFAFWAGPALVGAIGAACRRREILVGAGLSYVWMAALSFSGVTFILLAPALLFAYAGLRDAGRPAGDRPRDRPIVTLATMALLVGAFVGLFATMETTCWERMADGSYRTHVVTTGSLGDGEVSVGIGDVVASGCSGGRISLAGTTIVVACVAVASGLAIRVGRARA